MTPHYYRISNWWIFRKLSAVKWWVLHRLHPGHRYHVVRTGLPPGYYDPDTRITHAVFETVAEFYRQAPINWEYDEGHTAAGRILLDATTWWEKEGRDFDSLNYEDDWEEREMEYEETRSKHIAALGPILGYMWYP